MKNLKIISAFVLLFSSIPFTSFAGEWKQDNFGWKYQEDNGSYVNKTWKEINNEWYYFNEGGYMLSDTTTPDGYTVNKTGEWVENNNNNSTAKYEFDTIGSWVSEGKIPEGEYIYYSKEKMNNPIIYGSSSFESSTFNYIKIYKSDKINPGTYIPVKDAPQLDISGEGVFLVGKDIKAGTYSLKKNLVDSRSVNVSKCKIFNSIPSSKDKDDSNGNLNQDLFVRMSTDNVVTVKDGQYVQLINCSANFARP